MLAEEAENMDLRKPPAITQIIDLWHILHDATLQNLISDRTARTVTLTFSMPHLQEMLDQPVDTEFLIQCEAVSAVRVLTYLAFPTPFEHPAGINYQEIDELWDQHYAKGRWQSLTWATFERDCQDGTFSIEAKNALVFKHDKGIVFRITGCFPDDEAVEIEIDATSLRVTGQSGTIYALPEFIDMGKQFWKRLSERAAKYQRDRLASS